MGENADAAKAFREIADLLDLMGERFKPEAYRRAARSIESLTEDLGDVAKRDQLRAIPGVGPAIEEKVREFLSTGTIAYLDKVRVEVPAGVVQLMRIEGLGPKTARRFWTDLGVESPAALREAIDAGRLVGLGGFGPTKIAKIRTALDAATAGTERRPLLDAALVAERLVQTLRDGAPVDQVAVAGSFRRRRETVGDLDILVTSAEPEKVMEAFAAQPGIRVVLRGPTKETIRTADGLQVDLRVVPPESFGAALQYFTGSKDHNVQTRALARDRGLKINEYAVMRGEESLPSATEADVYKALNMAWVPPEIREAQGEVEAAREGRLPTLVEASDLVGEPHVHLSPSVTDHALGELHATAETAGLSYLGLVPHAASDLARISAWARTKRGPNVFVGREVPFAAREEGAGDAAFTILSGASGAVPSPPPAPETGAAPIWVSHLGGDPETADGPKRVAAWVRWAMAAGVALEVNPRPGYDGLDAVSCRRFVAGGGALVVSEHGCGAERPRALALGTARRAWVTKAAVLTAGPWPWSRPRSGAERSVA